MDGQPCDAWQSDDEADVAASVQTVRAQDVADGNAGALSQGPPLMDTQVCTPGNAGFQIKQNVQSLLLVCCNTACRQTFSQKH